MISRNMFRSAASCATPVHRSQVDGKWWRRFRARVRAFVCMWERESERETNGLSLSIEQATLCQWQSHLQLLYLIVYVFWFSIQSSYRQSYHGEFCDNHQSCFDKERIPVSPSISRSYTLHLPRLSILSLMYFPFQVGGSFCYLRTFCQSQCWRWLQFDFLKYISYTFSITNLCGICLYMWEKTL